MRTVPPRAAIAPFVRDLMIVEVGDQTQRLRMPEPGLVLAVRYRGFASVGTGDDEERLPDIALTGMAVRARDLRTSAGGAAVLVRFRPGGASRFFDEPLHELFGVSRPLTELASRQVVARVHDRVGSADDDDERVRAIEEFLLTQHAGQTDLLVTEAVQRLSGTADVQRIRGLAHDLGLSLDTFEKRFRRIVGCTPKQFASLMRLRKAIESYHPGVNLTQLALDVGYFDQAHFNRDLRAVTGKSPSQFFGLGS